MQVAGHLQEKKGYYYAVLSYQESAGKQKKKWISTKLPVKGNKKKAEAFLSEAKKNFVIPTSEILPTSITQTAGAYINEKMANMLFADYLIQYLSIAKTRSIEETTYEGYCNSVFGTVEPYFRELGVSLGNLQATDIQLFYSKQLKRVKANTVIRYHAIIRLAVTYARKMGFIRENPMDMVEKPKKNAFVGKFYDKDELNAVLKAVKGTKLEIPVLFGGFYGLRRSEIVGLRWSAIDWSNNVFYINHTVTTAKVDGEMKIIAKDRAKNKSSLRALPLAPPIKEKLLELKSQQEFYRRKFKRSYNKEWLEYILVDELGGLILPNYITSAWASFLERSDFRKIRFHDLRHTCASLLLNNGKDRGVTLKHIQEWLGHSDFSTTADIYSHLDSTAKACSVGTMMDVINL